MPPGAVGKPGADHKEDDIGAAGHPPPLPVPFVAHIFFAAGPTAPPITPRRLISERSTISSFSSTSAELPSTCKSSMLALMRVEGGWIALSSSPITDEGPKAIVDGLGLPMVLMVPKGAGVMLAD